MAFLEYLRNIGDAIAGTKVKVMGVYTNVDDTIVVPRATANGTLRVINQDYLWAISEGNLPGHTPVYQEAFLTSSNTGTSAVLMSKSTYTEQTSGAQRSIVSTSAADTLAGTGIQKVRINFIDSNGDAQSEVVNTNGTGYTDTVSTDIKYLNSIEATQVGSTGAAVGTVSLYTAAAGGGTIINSIAVDGWKTRTGIYYVPDGYTLFIPFISILPGSNGEFVVKATSMDSVFMELLRVPVVSGSHICLDNNLYRIPSNGKIALYYKTVTANQTWTAYISGWLEAN